MAEKRLYIIAGCNGAGKTTASKRFLPSILECRQWVNADEIAYGLSPLDPQSVSFQAGRLMLERIQELLNQNVTFAIETTLSTRACRNLVLQVQARGYRVELVFFYLPSPQIAIRRIAHRVKNGGHHVPDDVVIRRYHRGLNNLKEIFMPIVDHWDIYRYEGNAYVLMATGNKGDTCNLFDSSIIMDNTVPYLTEQNKRFIECCNQAVLDMITEEALHDGIVVMEDQQGNPIWVKAREVLEKNPGLKLKDVEYTPIEVDIQEIINSRTYHS